MDVIWTGTFVPDVGRNKRLREYLDLAKFRVRTVRVDVWPDDRVEAFRRRSLITLAKLTAAHLKLLVRLLLARRPDVYLVSYPGWFDLPVVRLVASLKRRPVVFDVFISLYDTAVSDRGLLAKESMLAKVVLGVDRLAIKWSDRVIADCPTHAEFLSALANVNREKVGVVYLSADESVFQRIPGSITEDTVLFYGTFVPLQGVDVIVDAAALLRDTAIRFEFIGEGHTKREAQQKATKLELDNVDFLQRMNQTELVDRIRQAGLCLGVFGTSAKAGRVIPHKLFEAIACGRPTLTGATPAVESVFDSNEVLTCEPGSAIRLAEAIRAAFEDAAERERVALRGYERFISDFSIGPQTSRLVKEFEKVL